MPCSLASTQSLLVVVIQLKGRLSQAIRALKMKQCMYVSECVRVCVTDAENILCAHTLTPTIPPTVVTDPLCLEDLKGMELDMDHTYLKRLYIVQ